MSNIKKVNNLLDNSDIKRNIVKLTNTITNPLNNMETCGEKLLNNISTALDNIDLNIPLKASINSNIKDSGKFIDNVSKSLLDNATTDLKHKIDKKIVGEEACNKKIKLGDDLSNGVLCSVAAHTIGMVDCSSGEGMDLLACMSMGRYSELGIKKHMGTVIAKKSNKLLNITSKSLDKANDNPVLRTVVKKAFKPKDFLNKAFNNKDKKDSGLDIGMKSINIFGTERLSVISKLTKKKHKRSNSILVGAIKQAIANA